MSSGVNPVFLKLRDIPRSDTLRPTVLEICLAAERSTGQGTIVGAQDIRGLWRIYPETKGARDTLLIKGIRLRDTSVKVCDTNPYSLRDNAGVEKPSTKVWIDNIPISVADSEIEHSLVSLGCELRSDVKLEQARDADGKLTRFKTGRRFVFITVPTSPLEKSMKVNIFTASVFHKEQKTVRKVVVCSRCLESGHHVSQCKNDVVCRVCKKPGHTRGSAACGLTQDDKKSDKQSGDFVDAGSNADHDVAPTSSTSSSEGAGGKSGGGFASAPVAVRPSRQASIRSGFEVRSRSASSKRRRSAESNSPQARMDKQQKRNGDDMITAHEDSHGE